VSNNMSNGMKRRELFKFAAGSAVVVSALRAQGPHKFFTPEEFAIMDEFTEILIPADEHSGGARAAKVAEYLDQQLAEAFDDELRQKARAGIALVDKVSMKQNEVKFMEATPKQRVEVVSAMSGNEEKPTTPEEIFFHDTKVGAIHAYYTSKIGIQEVDYKGNVIQAGTYAGELPSGPALGTMSSK
jgi:hypothetical protein